jgi:hypothetical protein
MLSDYCEWDYPTDFIEDALLEEWRNDNIRRSLLLTGTLWSIYL